MTHGGLRLGAGRKKGSPNKITQKRMDIAAAALEAAGPTPLCILLQAMREAYEQDGAIAAAPFAEKAAPYVHPRLAAVDAKVKGKLVIERVMFGGGVIAQDPNSELLESEAPSEPKH